MMTKWKDIQYNATMPGEGGEECWSIWVKIFTGFLKLEANQQQVSEHYLWGKLSPALSGPIWNLVNIISGENYQQLKAEQQKISDYYRQLNQMKKMSLDTLYFLPLWYMLLLASWYDVHPYKTLKPWYINRILF